jgi:hypothetical protein
MIRHAGMMKRVVQTLARLLAAIALVTQALMPGAMASAMSRPGDVPAFLCAMPGQEKAPGASALGQDLAALLAAKSGGPAQDADHDCHDCVLGQAAVLPAVEAIAARVSYAAPSVPATGNEARFWTAPRGPPLGARAPPELMKV